MRICRDSENLGVGAAACAALAARFEEFLPLLRLGGGAARGSAGPAGFPGAASHQALASAQAPEHAASSEAPDLGEAAAQVTPVLLGIWIGKTAVTSMLTDPSTKPENSGGRREDLSLGACIAYCALLCRGSRDMQQQVDSFDQCWASLPHMPVQCFAGCCVPCSRGGHMRALP